MYLHIKNVILITICLIFSTACTEEKNKDCAELTVDDTKIAPSQNKRNCLAKDSNKNIYSTSQLQAEDAEKNPLFLNFLTRKSDLSILNIPNDNNGNSVNVIKEAAGFISDYTTQGKKSNSDGEQKPVSTTVISLIIANDNNANSFNVIKASETLDGKTQEKMANSATEYTPVSTTAKNLVIDAYETTNVYTKGTDSADFDFIYTNNENALSILKAASSSAIDNKNKNIDDKNETQESELIFNSSLRPPLKTTNSLNESFNGTTSNQTSTESQLHDDEISFSEITNLSLNDEETLSLGQKIVFESSNVSAVAPGNSSPGAEILRNTLLTCGSLFGKRISFANETTLMEFPWTALLLYNTKMRYHCGGSLITQKYVLTAAHCVAQEFYELIGVRLGEHDISEPVDCAPDLAGDTICATTIDADVVKIIVHHQYSHISFKNDIALLRLDKEYISRSYYPICLPTLDMMSAETIATVAGWGATEKAIRSTILLKADVPIYDISKCHEIYRYTIFNGSTEICGSGVNEVDVCKGDSGGALFVSRNVKGKDKFYQLGVISLGVRRCGDSRFFPAVFTKITGFYNWIENNLEY